MLALFRCATGLVAVCCAVATSAAAQRNDRLSRAMDRYWQDEDRTMLFAAELEIVVGSRE